MTQESDNQAPVFVEPGVGAAYGNGWKQLWKNFLELLLTGIIYIAMTIPVGIIFGLIFTLGWQSAAWSIDFIGVSSVSTDTYWGAQVVNVILNVLYFTPLVYGLLFVFLTAARGEKIEIGNIFSGFRNNYLNILLVGLLFVAIFSLPSFLIGLLIDEIPVVGGLVSFAWAIISIILYCKLAFVPFLLLDKNLEAGEAIRTSWNWTNGHAWQVFFIILLAIPIMIAGLIILVVGAVPAIMWVVTSMASLYHAVKLRREPPQPIAPGGPFIMR